MGEHETKPPLEKIKMEPHPMSGLDKDYLNEMAALFLMVSAFEAGNVNAERAITYIQDKIAHDKKGILFKMYEERYPDKQFENVVNDENRENIKLLDNLAKKCNALYRSICDDKTSTAEEKIKTVQDQIMPITEEIRNLIEGEAK